MHQWYWQIWQGQPYLQCSLLKDWLHGFFTQHFDPQTPDALTTILAPKTTAYRVKQVHGNCVLSAPEIRQTTAALPEADGVLVNQAHESAWVCSADCTPALIADRITGQVAAVHAGWRGTALRILPEAINRFLAQGSRIENLLVALGPAISGQVYQVSEHVAAQVGASLLADTENLSDAEVLTTLADYPNSPLLPDPQPGRIRIDIRQVNLLQIDQLGVKPDHVAIAPHCTYQDSVNFFSYRRNPEKKVQWSGIVCNNH